MDAKKAAELVENQFSFDLVGPAMMKLRKNLDNEEIKNKLIQELYDAAVSECAENDADALELLRKASVARVEQYIAASKAGKGKGCS